jgi:hypothetical protein
MLAIERIVAAAAVLGAAHFAMGFIKSSAGGSGGSLRPTAPRLNAIGTASNAIVTLRAERNYPRATS